MSTASRVGHLLPFEQLVKQALLFHCGCGNGGCIAVMLQVVRSAVSLVSLLGASDTIVGLLQGLWAVLQM